MSGYIYTFSIKHFVIRESNVNYYCVPACWYPLVKKRIRIIRNTSPQSDVVELQYHVVLYSAIVRNNEFYTLYREPIIRCEKQAFSMTWNFSVCPAIFRLRNVELSTLFAWD